MQLTECSGSLLTQAKPYKGSYAHPLAFVTWQKPGRGFPGLFLEKSLPSQANGLACSSHSPMAAVAGTFCWQILQLRIKLITVRIWI